ncbi:RusA family crossover junction endodeoxyribonuclease [Aeromonas caviae]|uniref:RusA family crossover junction endodeoxyribonuclease n=1 Tax=Aeromonas caviae TaxID=648 RepID=UPI0038D0557A
MPKADSWTVTLPWPPSTNRIWRNVAVSGKPRTLLSEEGRRFRTTAAQMCMLGGVNNRQLAGRLAVSMVACPPDRRARDLDNVLKATLDALTHAGVWLDDSQIDLLSVERAQVVKGGELRVTISVKEAA